MDLYVTFYYLQTLRKTICCFIQTKLLLSLLKMNMKEKKILISLSQSFKTIFLHCKFDY